MIALGALHLLALWMESRGWIYYLRSQGTSTRMGSAMLEVQQLLEPEKKYVLEMKREEKRREEEAGYPPPEE